MPRTTVAAVRGAISVRANRAADIRDATARLLQTLLERNALTPDRIVSAVFTATPDLTADFPAHAARRLGWTDVPLLGAVELDVPGAPARIVRVLLTLRDVPRGVRLVPVYLDRAALLRPDLAGLPTAARPGRDGPVNRVAIVGLGQIGGSLGLALGHAGGWHRVGFDSRASARRAALELGAVDETARSLAAACAGAALAVVAVPVDMLPRVLAAAAAVLPGGAVLLDTGSARGAGVTRALVLAARRVRAVGGHPLAGNERRGLAGADVRLFAGAPFALMPVRGRVPAIVRALVRDLGAVPARGEPAAPRRRAGAHEPPALAPVACAGTTRCGRRARPARGARIRLDDAPGRERPARGASLRARERRERAVGMAAAARAARPGRERARARLTPAASAKTAAQFGNRIRSTMLA
jgi:chorismate mutase